MTDFPALESRTHREAAARLASDGWNVCGIGDWATVWRSADGRLAARISPFEPAYEVFVALCRNLEGHPMLPRIDFDAPLDGGGRLTVMEFLRSAAPADAEAAKRRWDEAAPGDPVTAVRREAERLDAEATTAIPYWGGLDHNPRNIMTGVEGGLKFVDLFYVDGLELYAALRDDPRAVAERLPAERRRHITEIGAVARLSTPEEIASLRRNAAAIG
ncbi:MAG TPA: hypothetical protein VKZ65_10765 [Glycomyces sp.]|nr:hypothetical protein [Glycomyces sp.]